MAYSLAESVLIPPISAVIGLCAHEMTHYFVARRWTDDVAIKFSIIFPTMVKLGDPRDLSPTQTRLFCVALTATLGCFFQTGLSVRRPGFSVYLVGFVFILLAAALPSPADIFGSLYPRSFTNKALKNDFSNIEALRFVLTEMYNRLRASFK